MNATLRSAALAAVLALAGCSATQARIDDNEDLFNSYPPEVQAMIKSNRIDRGFDSTQVYLALGNADRTEMNEGVEVWYYHQTHTQTAKEEKSAGEYREEMIAYVNEVAKGNENAKEPSTYRVFKLYRTAVSRMVDFEDGKVVSWVEPEDMWLDEWHR
jgi:outer membrane protein assembly factor BamE (lipoprotein component of BamABCDE complex)